VTRRTLSRWLKAGLPGSREGKEYTFDLAKVRAWMDRYGRTGSAGDPELVVDAPASPRAGVSVDAPASSQTEFGPLELEVDGESMSERYARARTAKEIGLAQKHHLDVAKRMGELVPREEVADLERSRIAVVKVGLESLAAKLRARLAPVTTDPAEVERITEAEVRALLESYADGRDVA